MKQLLYHQGMTTITNKKTLVLRAGLIKCGFDKRIVLQELNKNANGHESFKLLNNAEISEVNRRSIYFFDKW